MQNYNETFLDALAMLNPAQQQAVEHIEGPMLVIAGPGTGKTHILAARIGRILQLSDAQPQNILCLTFTEAGVQAMRKRLLQFIGPDAHRVHIHTFHSFCNSVIQNNLERFGRHDLEPMSDLERVEIIRRLIDELPLSHPLKLGRADVYYYEKHLHDLFSRMKAEDWSPAYVTAQIQAYLHDLPLRREYIYQVSRGSFKKGDPKQSKIDDETEKMTRLQAAADLLPRYRLLMQQARRYDYDDMILWVLRAFEEHEALLRNYQEQYLYFLVDEYQDTNGAQNEVIRQLVHYWDQPNLFIVGDDDQSVYEFQGARLKNLTDFYDSYREHLALVLLRENYRSAQGILDAAAALIAHNERRIVNRLQALGIDKTLTAGHPTYSQLAVQPQIRCYPNRLHEETDIVAQLARWQAAGIPPGEMAVIFAKHRQAQNLMRLLDKMGMAYQTKRRVNILDLPVVRNLRSLLEYLHSEFVQPHSGEQLLFQILHFDFLGLQPDELARLSVYQSRQAYATRLPWREMLAKAETLPELALESPAPFADLARLISQWLTDITALSLLAFVEKVINRSGLMAQAIRRADRVWQLQVLRTFMDFVQAESDRRPRLTLERLLATFQNMDANALAIELYKSVDDAVGVQLVTAHSAKGLEFQKVIIMDCAKEGWEPQQRGSNNRFPLPDTLTLSGEEDALEARRRLFYVAMTRAQDELWMTYSEADYREKPLEKAIFLDEILDRTALRISRHSLPVADLAAMQQISLAESETPTISLPAPAVIDRLLEGFTLNVSAMNRFLRCPLSFYYENVLKTPVVHSEAAAYGAAMHNALERLFEKMLLHKDRAFMSEAALIALFEYEMERQRGHFSGAAWANRLAAGRLHLAQYYQQHCATWHKQVRIEYSVRQVEVAGVPVTGKIDRVELYEQGKVVIVDYKTGRHDEAKMRPPTPAQPHGGTYWRQLIFYKLLYEGQEKSLNHQVTEGVVSYLEPDRRGQWMEKRLRYQPDEVATVRQLIRQVYDRILAHEFYEGCGEKYCAWCNFVRGQHAVDSFSDAEIEGLDD